MAYILQTQYDSKNYTPNAQVPATFGRPRIIAGATIHHWGALGQNFDTVRDFLCTNNTPTSAHYVAQAGLVACIVADQDAAWHAGNSVGNATTIGIECRPEATDGDYQTVAELIRDLRAIHGDFPLYPHSYWTPTACPGRWDLRRLDAMARAAGSGVSGQAGTITPITPITPAAPVIAPREWDEMASKEEIRQIVNEELNSDVLMNKYAAKVPFAWFYNKYGRPVQFESLLGQIDLNINSNHAALVAQIGALSSTVALLAQGTGLTTDQITEAAAAGARKAMEESVVSVDVNVQNKGDK